MKILKLTVSVVISGMLILAGICSTAIAALPFQDRNITVTVENEENIGSELLERISNDVLLYHTTGTVASTVNTRGIVCTLLGHDTVSNIVNVYEHKVREYNPRCLCTTYQVTTCSRCDYEDIEYITDIYVVCCPEE